MTRQRQWVCLPALLPRDGPMHVAAAWPSKASRRNNGRRFRSGRLVAAFGMPPHPRDFMGRAPSPSQTGLAPLLCAPRKDPLEPNRSSRVLGQARGRRHVESSFNQPTLSTSTSRRRSTDAARVGAIRPRLQWHDKSMAARNPVLWAKLPPLAVWFKPDSRRPNLDRIRPDLVRNRAELLASPPPILSNAGRRSPNLDGVWQNAPNSDQS